MKWTKGTKNDNVVDVRGRKSKAPAVAGGSVALAIVALIVSRLLGVDVTGLLGGGEEESASPTTGGAGGAGGAGGGGVGATSGGGGTGSGSAEPPMAPDPDAELIDFIGFAMKDIQDTFDTMYRAEGKSYAFAKLYIFTNSVNTACGRTSSAIGPFYCPLDSNAYIDLSFYRDLKARFGAPGDFAQVYVLAHEIGHHLQNLTRIAGNEPRRKSGQSKNEYSVRMELQADCFAGIWARSAEGKKLLEVGDLDEALDAATAIGDDRLSKQAGVEVNPETFTHGTSAQRVSWFRRGYAGRQLDACDTFAGPI